MIKLNPHNNYQINWISFVGDSVFALVNTFWAVVELSKEYISNCYLLVNEGPHIKNNAIVVSKWLNIITNHYFHKNINITEIMTKEIDIENIKYEIDMLLNRIPKKDKIFVDITPGRKYMSSLLMMASGVSANQVNKRNFALYLLLKDNFYSNIHFPRIPYPLQNLFSFKENKDLILSTRLSRLEFSNNNEPKINDKIILSKKDIVLLLNELWINGNSEISVFNPFINEKFCTFKMINSDVIIQEFITFNKYNQLRNNLISKFDPEDPIKKEIPNYQQLLDVFDIIGCLDKEQTKKVKKIIEKLEYNTKINLRPTIIAIDTNLLIRSFYRTLKYQIELRNYFKIKNNQIPVIYHLLIPKSVENEVIFGSDEKINKTISKKLKSFYLKTKMFNQPTLKARIFQNGLHEVFKLKKEEKIFNGLLEFKDKKGDVEIAKELEEFSMKKTGELIYITADKEKPKFTLSKGIQTILWPKYRFDNNNLNISWDQLTKFLFYLTQLYGILKLKEENGNTIETSGMWERKTIFDWENSNIQIKCDNFTINNIENKLRLLKSIKIEEFD